MPEEPVAMERSNPVVADKTPLDHFLRLESGLRFLIAAGRSDSTEAVALRSEMAGPWDRLTNRERESLEGWTVFRRK